MSLLSIPVVLLLGASEPILSVTLVKLSATEAKSAVSKTVDDQLEPIKGCYDLALKEQPRLKGDLKLSFELEAGEERLSELKVDEASTLKDDTVSACASARFKAVRWPVPKAKSSVSVTLRFSKR